jgi:hypothetical protein
VVEADSLVLDVVTWDTLVAFSVNLDVTLGWVTLAEPLSDGDGEVGEIDILVLRASPSSVATCSPSGSMLDCRS